MRKIQRAVSEEALANPEAMRFLVNENDRLEIENIELKNYQKMFYEADKKVAVLQEKSKTDLAIEIYSGVLFTVGAAMLGYAPALWKSQPLGGMVLVFGAVMIIGGIIAKVVKR